MVLRQILHLDNASCPAAGPVGSVELKHPTGTAVCAYGFLHRLILTDGGFRKLLAKRKNLLQLCRHSFEHFRNFLLAQGIDHQAIIRKPLLHLLYRVGVIQSGQLLHGVGKLFAGADVHGNRLMHQLHIQCNTSVVDFLVKVILVPHSFRHRELGEFFLDGHFDLNITDVISLEGRPFVRRVFRQIAGPTAVGLRRRTGLTEILDEFFAFGQLLLPKPQNGTDALQ